MRITSSGGIPRFAARLDVNEQELKRTLKPPLWKDLRTNLSDFRHGVNQFRRKEWPLFTLRSWGSDNVVGTISNPGFNGVGVGTCYVYYRDFGNVKAFFRALLKEADSMFGPFSKRGQKYPPRK